MTGLTLYQMTDEYVEAARQLAAMAESGEIDQQALADTLDGIRGALEVKAVNVAAYSKHLDYQAQIIDVELDRLRAYKATVERQAEALRNYLHDQMNRAGIVKIENIDGAPPFRLAIRKNPPRVVIDNEGAIEWEYKRSITKVEIDRQMIKDALKAGRSVPGAHMEQTERVEIR
jgi:hypothetical protein